MNRNFLTILIVLLCFNAQASLDVMFSKTRGHYANPFSLIIEADDPGAIIRYTTNGKTPTFNVGSTYNGAININTIKVVKAFAYSTTDTTKVEGHTYIFINDVLNQVDSVPGFPYATGFSTSIKNDGTYGALLDDALLSIPVMSLSLNLTDYNFIYNNKGTSKQAYIEYFEPATTETYGRPTGVSTYGNTSFSAANANKKNYRLRFKEAFGASKFKYKIFGDEAASDFDIIDLRCGSQESFDRGGIQNIHEQIMKDWQTKTSGYGVHGKFTHLYINGVYWGVYNASERPVKSFGESYFGGDKDDYNTMKATCCDDEALAIDGSNTSYNLMKSQTNNYPAIEQYLDVDHFIDYVMICNYGPHGDWRTWNTYAFDNPTANVPFRFFVWDPEPSFKNDWYYTDIIVDTRDHEDIWQPLKANADFKMCFADHVECNCIQTDGALHPNNATADYDASFQQHKLAYLAEAARWANKNLYNEFLDYRDDIINTNWFFDRTDNLIEAYKNNNLYPNLDAVSFSQYGGVLNTGSSITLSNTNGTGSITYTIDRSDPRATGGGLGSTAQTYNANINLPAGVYEIKARVKQNSNWSAMCPRKFYVGQNYGDLVINEIHYNPEDSIFFNPTLNAMDTVSGRNFEFIELKNTGSQAVYLEDVHFNKGVTLQFASNTIIEPNGFTVIAEDAFWFEQKYGFLPDATYMGKLENSGENIWLLDPIDNIIDTLKYDDALPWDTIPDNGTYSLALIDATLNNGTASSWSAQVIPTTPKAENIFCSGALAFNQTTTNISCNGANDGIITGSGFGGTPAYTYQWDNGSSSNTISDLAPGNYILILTDDFGCEFIGSYQITQPNVLSAIISASDQTYYQSNNGTANIIASGGTPPYSYNWSNGATTSSINNLAPGNYSVDIADAGGCSFQKSAIINAVICNTLQVDVDINHESCFGEADGLLHVTNIQNASSSYSILWSTGNTGTVSNNLVAGTYQLNITDNTGCVFEESYTINAATALSVDTIITNASSNTVGNGSIDLTVNGGTAPYTYYWSTASSNEDISGLTPGNYWVSITDATDCQLLVNNIEVESNCQVSIIQQNNPLLVTNVYQVAAFIQSNGMVNNNEQVSFKAGNYIELNDDFEVIQGADFEARIEGCQ